MKEGSAPHTSSSTSGGTSSSQHGGRPYRRRPIGPDPYDRAPMATETGIEVDVRPAGRRGHRSRRPRPRRPARRRSRCPPTASATGSSASCSARRCTATSSTTSASASPPRWRCSRPTTCQLERLRHRGDPPRRSCPAVGLARLLAGDADHRRAAGDAGAADPLLPRDDQGLPVGRRRLPRHPRQLRHRPRPGRRRRAARRLHPHGVGVGVGRHRGAHLAFDA